MVWCGLISEAEPCFGERLACCRRSAVVFLEFAFQACFRVRLSDLSASTFPERLCTVSQAPSFAIFAANIVDATSYYSYDAPAYYFSNNIALWTWTNQVGCNVGDYPNGFDFPAVVYQLPGTPGITMDTHDVAAWFDSYVVFPTAGFYEMGVGSDDGFRLSEGIGLKRQVLHVTGTGIDTDVAAVVSTTNYGNGGFAATLPQTPITAPVFVVTSNNYVPFRSINLSNKIAVITRGFYGGSSGFNCYLAATNGAVGAILLNRPAKVLLP